VNARQRYEIRPLVGWIGAKTRDRKSSAVFRARWNDTLDLLGRETEMLGARLVVIQIDVTDGDIRRDGQLRANARVGFPGVKVAFDSKHGPLTYATDEYADWQSNVRAVALGLQALRAVDRYGITKSGEQYRGFVPIGSAAAEDEMTPDEAARVLADAAGVEVGTLTRSRDADERRKVVTLAFRAAAKTAHPDAGGNGDAFRLISRARDVLLEATA
jgi:hypothetical protein